VSALHRSGYIAQERFSGTARSNGGNRDRLVTAIIVVLLKPLPAPLAFPSGARDDSILAPVCSSCELPVLIDLADRVDAESAVKSRGG
jgi:hypothetical protein